MTQSAGEPIYFRRHQHLSRSGDVHKAVFRLEDGWACRYRVLTGGRRRQITGLFLPGEYCEPQWVLGGTAAQPVIALTALRANAIPLGNEQKPAAQDAVLSMLRATLSSINHQSEWIVSLGCKTATERISELLCDLFDRLRAGGKAGEDRCAMPLTQTDLADITGLTAVHVNRVLKGLRANGLIDLCDRRLHILDAPGLRQAAAI